MMEILEPVAEVPRSATRGKRQGSSPHEFLYQQVLALNGKALPVSFDTLEEAADRTRSWQSSKGRATTLGIKVVRRGNVAYLFKKDKA